MMDRLLTREELGTVPVRLGQYARGVSREYDYLGRVAQAQDAKSIRVDRKAMAGWGHELCDDLEHDPEWVWGVERQTCRDCLRGLFEATREGKAPWETD